MISWQSWDGDEVKHVNSSIAQESTVVSVGVAVAQGGGAGCLLVGRLVVQSLVATCCKILTLRYSLYPLECDFC